MVLPPSGSPRAAARPWPARRRACRRLSAPSEHDLAARLLTSMFISIDEPAAVSSRAASRRRCCANEETSRVAPTTVFGVERFENIFLGLVETRLDNLGGRRLKIGIGPQKTTKIGRRNGKILGRVGDVAAMLRKNLDDDSNIEVDDGSGKSAHFLRKGESGQVRLCGAVMLIALALLFALLMLAKGYV